MGQNLINCLYSHFKNSPQKLKIVCDWDEVIQPHEPYALWRAKNERSKKGKNANFLIPFTEFFKEFWEKDLEIVYFPYGSKIKEDVSLSDYQQAIKNSPNFYQEAPFLTIAKELLMLIREGKVEKLIFLSAYDKRKFPQGDSRKKQIFGETFGHFPVCKLELVGFNNEKQGVSKADWVKENASEFELVIDDNPTILKSILKNNPRLTACAPYYPSVKNKQAERVLLVKTSISDLKKEDIKLQRNF
ncbi:MAG: hypothetical protein I3273_01870 [Candidatus Moeniiplasma glomeromycotorum]|nr:hypothetical protein [Candidatus Moeniiplasma glomeromycotorum]MCE8167133.1 hypothetical protein [Candidatus Moeniiplasma glomeromycotorum]MCE8168855.1 hypothetical protein [Candidatus Moeniiplasma glomeromycotorum]